MTTKGFHLSRRGLLKLGGTAVALNATYQSSVAATKPTAELFYADVGTGPNVLLLHGWVWDSHVWSWQIARAITPHSSDRIRIAAEPDVRHGHQGGIGLTDKPRVSGSLYRSVAESGPKTRSDMKRRLGFGGELWTETGNVPNT